MHIYKNADLKDKNPTDKEMSQSMKQAEKELARMVCPIAHMVCPKCDHCYGYVYADEEDNENQRSVASCGCACAPVTVQVGKKAPATPGGPVPPPGPGQLLRTKGHHSDLCQDTGCKEADCRKSSPATGVTEGNSSVSAQTLPDEEDGVKEPIPMTDDSVFEDLGQKPALARFAGGGNSSVSADLGQEPAPATFAGRGNSSAFSGEELTYDDHRKVAEDIAWTKGNRPIHGDERKRWTCHLGKCWLPYPGSGRTLNGRGSYGSCNGHELCDACHKAGGYSPRGIWD